jgi:hypothetical protein
VRPNSSRGIFDDLGEISVNLKISNERKCVRTYGGTAFFCHKCKVTLEDDDKVLRDEIPHSSQASLREHMNRRNDNLERRLYTIIGYGRLSL